MYNKTIIGFSFCDIQKNQDLCKGYQKFGPPKESFGPRKKWDESKKVEREGWGRGKKGMLARKPLDFKKRPLVFTVEFIY